MRVIFFTFALIIMSTNAFAASATLNMKVQIVNLTQMPITEAIAFCDERNMVCPALREKYAQRKSDDEGLVLEETVPNNVEKAFNGREDVQYSDIGYYME